jgi:hypothetical protein
VLLENGGMLFMPPFSSQHHAVILLKRDFDVSTEFGVNSYGCAGHKRRWIF